MPSPIRITTRMPAMMFIVSSASLCLREARRRAGLARAVLRAALRTVRFFAMGAVPVKGGNSTHVTAPGRLGRAQCSNDMRDSGGGGNGGGRTIDLARPHPTARVWRDGYAGFRPSHHARDRKSCTDNARAA